MQLFYSQDFEGQKCFLDEVESRHCIKVLRLNKNDSIKVIDGKGCFYDGIITNPNYRKVEIEITNKTFLEKNPYHIHIAIAPTKNIDRFEWFLEKATEIGVDEITPILCKRSERDKIKPERLEKIVLSAVKQSIKPYIPKLNSLQTFNDFLKQQFTGQKFIAHCIDSDKKELKKVYKAGNSCVILIGPEGDFTPEEINLCMKEGFIEVNLGKSRLRTETAGIVACHTITIHNE